MSQFLLESIIKREGGTRFTMGTTAYHFAPDTQGRHVAVVSDGDHLAKLLAIPEGFRLLGQIDASVTPGAKPAIVQPAPVAPEVIAPVIEAVAAILPVAPIEPEPVVLNEPQPPATPAPAEAGAVSAPLTEEQLLALSDADLRAEYKAAMGRAAPPRAKHETMAMTIIEQREVAGN